MEKCYFLKPIIHSQINLFSAIHYVHPLFRQNSFNLNDCFEKIISGDLNINTFVCTLYYDLVKRLARKFVRKQFI